MTKWSDIVENAHEKGFFLDGCGKDERYYWNGAFWDFCGFDISKEKCYCGYASDNQGGGSGSGDTGSTSYAGILKYPEYSNIDSITDQVIKDNLSSVTENVKELKDKGLVETVHIPSVYKEGYGNMTEEEYSATTSANAYSIVFAFDSTIGIPTILQGGTTPTLQEKSLTIDGKNYNVYGAFYYMSQANIYDENGQEQDLSLEYTFTW
jgi:hypothetical protein